MGGCQVCSLCTERWSPCSRHGEGEEAQAPRTEPHSSSPRTCRTNGGELHAAHQMGMQGEAQDRERIGSKGHLQVSSCCTAEGQCENGAAGRPHDHEGGPEEGGYCHSAVVPSG